MEAFLSFFENLSSLQKIGWIVLCLMISWLLEAGIPLVQLNYKKWQHAGRNLIFLGTSMIINLLFGILIVAVTTWTSANEFGFFYLLDLPTWAVLLVAIMLLDFVAQYVAHYTLHRVAFMWRFHMVHHSDTEVDATTGTRHHPGDYTMRELFAVTAVIVSGMPIAFYLVYRILSILFTYFSHANINLPLWLDKTLSLLFITPNMHKFHHHFERPWTDTNFGNIFSLWDRIFGTYVYDDPRKVKYGLDVLNDDTSDDVAYQFKLPFDKSVKTD